MYNSFNPDASDPSFTKLEQQIFKPQKRLRQYMHTQGTCNFVKSDDIRILRDIEQYYSTQIDEMPMNVADLI